MNAHMREKLGEIARKARAIVVCPDCSTDDICAFDDGANSHAYALATTAWKADEFRSASREEVMAELKNVIDDANHECPNCTRWKHQP